MKISEPQPMIAVVACRSRLENPDNAITNAKLNKLTHQLATDTSTTAPLKLGTRIVATNNGKNHSTTVMYRSSHECGIESGPLRMRMMSKSVLMSACTARL